MSVRLKRALAGTALVVVLAGGGLAVADVAFDKTSVRHHAIDAGAHAIVVTSGSGNVELVPSSGRIDVRETQHYVLDRPSFRQHLVDGVLTLASDCGASVVRCDADLRVSVPAGVGVTVRADSGDVSARGIDVPSAHANSDSGDVRLELAGRPRLAWAHTDSGDVDVVAAASAGIDAQSDSGDVTVDSALRARRINARTDSGDVVVSVPRGEYAVDTHTDSGDTKLDDGVSRNDRAARSIQARTDSGDVDVRAR
jgi:hypothetical protein